MQKNEEAYLFTSDRLGFRNWLETDLSEFAKINADPAVMAHFPFALTFQETKKLMARLQAMYLKMGYTYFAVQVLKTGEFIGFIGLAYQDYEAPFNPATDIGWRLKKSAWGKGFATEGAKRCVDYAFNELKLDRLVATCTVDNEKSENVMQKIGMTRQGAFKHSKLKKFPDYEQCVWYTLSK
ncbi:GNAT family N-acetyltransferase [Aquimarina agarilytica]|uniref:GNAT family N-acetyltransferase n=1 Tax=Aquimarina agarilytica TaxID=1087449 RepID=UPI00028A17D7|nr:GNAT family N-acetyltransferase [Aquimarina agarilytica]